MLDQSGFSSRIALYTDGACSGNPGPGGWAALLIYNHHERMISGGAPMTTNNRMELTAAIEGLKALKKECCVDLFTDSLYVKNGIELWIKSWKASHWQRSGKAEVKNIDLWKNLDDLCSVHQVNWHWVRGHSGNVHNECVDQAARSAILTFASKG